MNVPLRLLIVAIVLLATACGSNEGHRSAEAPECRRAADCLITDGTDAGFVLPPCHEAACVDNVCRAEPVEEGTSCDDADETTIRDACQGTVCKGEPATCAERAGPCKQATLDPETNECTLTDLPDGTACDDEDACTEVDSCQEGTCVGGSPITCTAKDSCHVAGTCDPKTGKCDDPAAKDGTACDDTLTCTENDACEDGECKGSAKVCDDGIDCSVDACDEAVGGCTVDISACSCTTSASCDDKNPCNGVEVCDTKAGQCISGTPVDCSAKNDACRRGACDPGTGECVATPVADGQTCDDGSLCTRTDTCKAGVCTGASPVTCTALDQCHTAGTCDARTGVCSTPAKANGTACNDGKVCTITDVCTGGACGGAARVCNDGVACTVDGCSETGGGCVANTGACGCTKDADCSDGNACNGAETCDLKTLTCKAGTAVNCGALTDACNTGTCNPTDGKCTAVPKPNGTTCSDGNACTQFDACSGGRCVGSAITCPTPDQCHTAGTCNPATGQCSNPAKATGTTCNDGLVCTTGDACDATGACKGAARVCNDGIACTVDSCSEAGGGCVANASNCQCSSDAQCNDGNACNGVETCNLQTRTCVAGTAVSCAAQTNACNVGTCNPQTGACTAAPRPNGTTCNDGSLCTTGDACQSGRCVGTAVTCPAPDQCHNTRTCDPANGQCTNPAKANGTACNDGKTCTSSDVCTNGVCGGGALACGDAIACTVDSCAEPTGCVHDTASCQCTRDSDCNDGNACNGAETCDLATFTCKAGTAVNCGALTNACNTGTCTPATGECTAVPKTNGTACNDGSLCTTGDSCQAGRCAGTAVACPAPDQCHDTRTCDPSTGQCTNPPKTNGTPCNDGLFCTSSDVCTGGVCGGAAVACNDGIACTVDTCTEVAKGCTSDTAACECTTDAQCSDGNACNGVETCNLANFTCRSGTAVDCSGLTNACNTGTCAPATGACTAVPKTNGTACSDGSACTTGDTCQSGRCTGTAVTCPTPDQCHNAGTCNPATGACSNPAKPVGTACNDGNACTATDTCNASGQCTGAGAVVCTQPTNTCQVATCVSPTGCQTTTRADNSTCDDGSTCTINDVCRAGTCTGTARDDRVSDWGDAPGAEGGGPTSIDLMAYSDGVLGAVGVFRGPIVFTGKTLNLNTASNPTGTTYSAGLYLAQYRENGVSGAGTSDLQASIARVASSVAPGSFTVQGIAVQPDDGFSVIGTVSGAAEFGLQGGNVVTLSVSSTGFAAGYGRNGALRWLVLQQQEGGTSTFDAVAATTGAATVIAGTNTGTLRLVYGAKQELVATMSPAGTGAWAARVEKDGTVRFLERVAVAKGTIAVRGVTSHSDESFTILGTFDGSIDVGPNLEQPFTGVGATVDTWVGRYDAGGAYRWGAHLASSAQDRAGAIHRGTNDSVAVAVETNASAPFIETPAGGSQSLPAPASSLLVTQLVVLSKDGTPLTSAVIGGTGRVGSVTSWALGLGADNAFTLSGTFNGTVTAYGAQTLGGSLVTTGAISLTSSGLSLFVSRHESNLALRWAAAAGGVNSAMTSSGNPTWDIVEAVHKSGSITVGGMFQATSTFGIALPKSLTPANKAGSPFITHVDSQLQQDPCR